MWEKLKKITGFIKIENNITDGIMGIFMFAILAVFPLYYHNYYLDLVDIKYRFFYISVFVTAILVVLIHLCFRVRGIKKSKRQGEFSVVDAAMLLFWFAFLISTLLSDYKYEAMWGNEGTWVGMFLITVFLISYLSITRNLSFKSWYLEVFLVSGLLVSLLGIAHFFYFDPLHMKIYLNDVQKDHFVSTLGNINQYTAYIALFMAVSTTLFATSERWLARIWHYVCMIVSLVALILGISDNGYLSTITLLLLLPLYLFSRKDWTKRYVVMLATYASVMAGIGLFLAQYQGKTIPMDSLFSALSNTGMLSSVAIFLWCCAAFGYLWDFIRRRGKHALTEKNTPVIRYLWVGILFTCMVIFMAILIDINLGGHSERYGKLKEYLLITDSWGTYRGWAWKTGLRAFREFSLKDKLFGYGPETFYILMVNQYWGEMASVTGLKFMSAHNQYIQYLVTTGILGLMSYLGLLAVLINRMVRHSGKNKMWVMPIVFAILCYNVQNIVNFDSTLVTPVYWILIYLGIVGCGTN